MTKEAENNVDNSGEILASLDDSIEIIADEKGREIRKSADHPDKTRDIIFLDEDEENQENENSNNTSVLLDKVTKKTEVHETISVSPTTNTGTVKEYLTDLGLGILKDHQNGIILFHCDNLWMNGTKVASLPRPDIRRKFLPGTRINYLDLVAKSPEYGTISPSYNLPQAFAVWPLEENKPRGIPHQVQDELDYDELKVWRMDFVQAFKDKKFLRLDCVKVLAQIKGYFDEDNGVMEIIERKDGGSYIGKKVLFNKKSVRLFKKPLHAEDRLREIIPIGLRVSFDGIRVEKNPSLDKYYIEFQACYLFAGTWPQVPDPTCFPATDGFRSYAPDYNPGAWCYLDCEIKGKLEEQLDRLTERLDRDHRMYLQTWSPSGRDEIRSRLDHDTWKRRYAPRHYNHDRPRVPMGVGNFCGGIKRKQQLANTFGGFREQIMVKVEPKSEKFKSKGNETNHDDTNSSWGDDDTRPPPSKRPRISFIKTEHRR